MKYLNKESDPATTIKHYETNGYSYKVEYMDGSSGAYYSSSEDEETRLENLMIKQAKMRNEALKKEITPGAILRDIITEGMLIYLTGATMANEHAFLGAVLALGSIVFGRNIIDAIRKKREVDKFDLLFSMYEDLDTVNDAKFMEVVELDHFYQNKLDINNVDKFTYGDVKTLKRHLQNQ